MAGPATLPAAKLWALLLKQISKPIAKAIKEQAKTSPVFRKYICLPPARFYNWCETSVKMWLLRLGHPAHIAVLSEEMTVELGADLLGEGVIFLIAAGIVIVEYNRSSRKEAAKEKAKKQEMSELKRTLTELYMQVEEQGATIRHLSRLIGELEARGIIKPIDHHEDSKSPPSPPPPPSKIQQSPDLKASSPQLNKKEQNGIISKAIKHVEHILFNQPSERQNGILILALNHLYQDVYRVPLRF